MNAVRELQSAIYSIESAISEISSDNAPNEVLIIALAYACRKDQDEEELTRAVFDYDTMYKAVRLSGRYCQSQEVIAKRLAKSISRKIGVIYDD